MDTLIHADSNPATAANTTTTFTPGSDLTQQLAPQGTKLLLAVHGIGDQTAYETIQSVALRVGAHLGRPVATPLGRFYSKWPGAPIPDPPVAMPQFVPTNDPGPLAGIGLAEAYWAPIPRDVATRKFILEETKRWARSIVGRVASRSGEHWSPKQVDRLVVVLDEMVETIRIIERLTFLAEKAGVFKFDLGKLLVDFVGDVQLVADFQVFRERILATFDAAVTRSLSMVEREAGDVYIVAHSEGTVVTFVALLEALADPVKYPWIRRIRGLMTIGSPIEVHHLLWPSLWRDADLTASPDLGDLRIEWHNYMDFGDPIAYELIETSKWLDSSPAGFGKHLKPVTHAFSRYVLPGKAHVDYWADDDVFGHFLDNVVGLTPHEPTTNPSLRNFGKKTVNYLTQAKGEVRSKLWVSAVAFLLPYLLVFGLLCGAVYVLEHAVSAAFGGQFSLIRVARDVVGIGVLMFGITAASRLPRIADSRKWTAGGWILLAISLAVFGFVASIDTQILMGSPSTSLVGLDAKTCVLPALPWPIGCPSGTGISWATLAVAIASALVVTLSSLWTKLFPRRGHYMLPALGLLAALFIVASIWRAASTNTQASLVGVLLASVAFFYLWWLSALLFDLAFIWRRYARHSALREHLVPLRPTK